MTAFVANEMSALQGAGMIGKYREDKKEGRDVLLSGTSRRAGNESTRGNIEGDE
jgi:hypothetical protein